MCSKEPIVRQYDHGVQGTNALPPFGGENFDGPNDAVVLTPILGKPYGLVQSHGMNPILNRIDPYYGSIWATAEAMANYVAVGGDPDQAVLVNNYIWPFPDEESMGSLDRSVDAVVNCMDVLKRPVISGKDSLSSTYRGKDGQVIKIPPVLCVSVFDDEQLLYLTKYIHLNPQKSVGTVPTDFIYSSLRDYLLLNQKGKDWLDTQTVFDKFFSQSLNARKDYLSFLSSKKDELKLIQLLKQKTLE